MDREKMIIKCPFCEKKFAGYFSDSKDNKQMNALFEILSEDRKTHVELNHIK